VRDAGAEKRWRVRRLLLAGTGGEIGGVIEPESDYADSIVEFNGA
jgi:hypothetical protein